jgi:pimeloyl-ACP methyl ester carboxylesterase
MTSLDWPVDTWVEPRPVPVADGTRLAVRVIDGDARPFVLAHGLASNALLWRNVAEALNDHGHAVAVVDLRGHGRSERPEVGHSTAQAADDLSAISSALGWQGRRPVAVGQSWGGNVVLRAARDQSAWGGVATVDGGWIHLGNRFPSFDACWTQLAPPDLSDRPPAEVIAWIRSMVSGWPDDAAAAVAGNLELRAGSVHNRLDREHHRSILHSLWADDPADVYPDIAVPTHLMVAGSSRSADVDHAESMISDATVTWYPDAHHDLHLQHPRTVSEQLLQLVQRVKGSTA